MRVVLVLATLLVVSLAGCVSDDEPEPAGSSSSSSAAPAPSGSAGATTDTEGDDADEPVPEVKVLVPYKTTFTDSGLTAAGVWVCNDTTGAGECNGHEIAPGDPVVTFDYPDQLIALTLELTWERMQTTNRFMVAEVTATPADGGEPVVLAVEYDTSPLVIELPEASAGAGTLSVDVWPRSDIGAGPVFLFADPESQPYDIKGELTLMPSE